MSATILRNLVSSVFNIKATKVVLSGEISHKYSIHNHVGQAYMDYEDFTQLFGFNPKDGFKELTNEFATVTSYSNGNHHQDTVDGCPLLEVDGIEQYLFFVEISERIGISAYRDITLFGAADFKTKIASIEAADLARWEQWLK